MEREPAADPWREIGTVLVSSGRVAIHDATTPHKPGAGFEVTGGTDDGFHKVYARYALDPDFPGHEVIAELRTVFDSSTRKGQS